MDNVDMLWNTYVKVKILWEGQEKKISYSFWHNLVLSNVKTSRIFFSNFCGLFLKKVLDGNISLTISIWLNQLNVKTSRVFFSNFCGLFLKKFLMAIKKVLDGNISLTISIWLNQLTQTHKIVKFYILKF